MPASARLPNLGRHPACIRRNINANKREKNSVAAGRWRLNITYPLQSESYISHENGEVLVFF
jgi:hypothetical protein